MELRQGMVESASRWIGVCSWEMKIMKESIERLHAAVVAAKAKTAAAQQEADRAAPAPSVPERPPTIVNSPNAPATGNEAQTDQVNLARPKTPPMATPKMEASTPQEAPRRQVVSSVAETPVTHQVTDSVMAPADPNAPSLQGAVLSGLLDGEAKERSSIEDARSKAIAMYTKIRNTKLASPTPTPEKKPSLAPMPEHNRPPLHMMNVINSLMAEELEGRRAIYQQVDYRPFKAERERILALLAADQGPTAALAKIETLEADQRRVIEQSEEESDSMNLIRLMHQTLLELLDDSSSDSDSASDEPLPRQDSASKREAKVSSAPPEELPEDEQRLPLDVARKLEAEEAKAREDIVQSEPISSSAMQINLFADYIAQQLEDELYDEEEEEEEEVVIDEEESMEGEEEETVDDEFDSDVDSMESIGSVLWV